MNSALDLTGSFPRNEKFLYKDSPFNTLAAKKLVRSSSGSLQRSLTTKYLSPIDVTRLSLALHRQLPSSASRLILRTQITPTVRQRQPSRSSIHPINLSYCSVLVVLISRPLKS